MTSSPSPSDTTPLSPLLGEKERHRLLGTVLRDVSRAFYLTLRVLPSGMREPVGLAYLLARAADTLADTPLLPVERRLPALRAFRALVEGPATAQGIDAIIAEVAGWEGSDGRGMDAERVLVGSLPLAFSMLESLGPDDRRLVRTVVVALSNGMEMDLSELTPDRPGEISAIQDNVQLDAYVYGVAGCVGEFWTAISLEHQPALKHWDASRMTDLGVRFGKALQMTNVLRDVPRDLRNGRCYLPEGQLTEAGLLPEELLEPNSAPKARPVLVRNLKLALDHYLSAEEYLLALPRRCFRLRLAVAWPLLMGLATLVRVARNPDWLHPSHPSRVSRGWVYRTMALSALCGWSNSAMRWWIRRLRSQLEATLPENWQLMIY